jgi:hypothetical protein
MMILVMRGELRFGLLGARNRFVDESMPTHGCHSACLRDFDNLCYQLFGSSPRPPGPFIIKKMVVFCAIPSPGVQ